MAELDYTLRAVDKNGSQPITQQIAALVVKNVETQRLSPGDRLPAERELADRLGVARGTVKAAYKSLEKMNVIRTRQGSGSFVIRDEELTRKLRREQAVDLLRDTLAGLAELGFSAPEIRRLFESCMTADPGQTVSAAIVYDTPELLLDLKRQLASLPGISVSIFILDSVTEAHKPGDLLRDFDIIIAPVAEHRDMGDRLPKLGDRLMQAAVAPNTETLVALSALPRDVRIGIICRSNTFLALVKGILGSYGFREGNILSFFEMDYTTETYFPGGIDVLVSFEDAHIFTNPDFAFRNEEFWAKGGKIIPFRHQFERGSLIYIEDRVRQLRSRREENPSTL